LKRPIPHSYWIEPGRLLAGEHPAGDGDRKTKKRLERLLDTGIDLFIDLTEEGECFDYCRLLPASVAHRRFPLVDHSVPEDAQRLRAILDVLAQALRAGRKVYVHCRAGIGRTGMVIGCHLAETGELAESALETLNHLWLQDARSAFWPRIPETAAQARFVLQWHGGRPVALGERALGALVGLAVGDALAYAVQLQAGKDEPAVAAVSRGWTDDTAMTLCVSESLVACRGVDARDQLERYRLWLRQGDAVADGAPAGARPAVRRAVAMAGWRRGFVMGSHDPTQLDPDPLSRCVAPALYFHDDIRAAIAAGAETARVTNQAPLVVDACRLFTGLLHAALNGAPKDEILSLPARFPDGPLRPELLAMAQGWSAHHVAAQVSEPGTILSVLDAVMRAFVAHGGYAAGLRVLAATGIEADVACSAYGSLAGAAAGLEAIPLLWRESLPGVETLERLAARLVAVRAV
jgi:ADP-ribosylglycohydrolase